jgi:hypothetical protein
MGQALVLHETLVAGRSNGLLVQTHCIGGSPFDSGDFRPDEGGSVLEILRAILRPDLELSVMRDQSLEMLLSLLGKCVIPGCREVEATTVVEAMGLVIRKKQLTPGASLSILMQSE